MDFDQRQLVSWVEHISPCVVWLGYNGGGNCLPEPSLDKLIKLRLASKKRGVTVFLKTVRGK